jgi:hypothetical protein
MLSAMARAPEAPLPRLSKRGGVYLLICALGTALLVRSWGVPFAHKTTTQKHDELAPPYDLLSQAEDLAYPTSVEEGRVVRHSKIDPRTGRDVSKEIGPLRFNNRTSAVGRARSATTGLL